MPNRQERHQCGSRPCIGNQNNTGDTTYQHAETDSQNSAAGFLAAKLLPRPDQQAHIEENEQTVPEQRFALQPDCRTEHGKTTPNQNTEHPSQEALQSLGVTLWVQR